MERHVSETSLVGISGIAAAVHQERGFDSANEVIVVSYSITGAPIDMAVVVCVILVVV